MATGSLGVLSAKVALDTVDFNKNITAMKRELKVAKSETELASKGIVGFGQSTKASGAQLDGLTKQINIQKQALQTYDDQYRKAIETKGEDSAAAQKAAANYNSTTLEIQKLTAEHEKLTKTMAYNDSNYKKVSDGLGVVGETANRVGDGMISVGKKWTIAGAAIGGIGAITAKAAIDYEDSFAAVTKTVDGTTKQLDDLSDGIRKMATEIPVSASELTELAATAGQLGIQTPNILGFTRTIADLGVATNLAGEEGASQLAKFANITKMSQTDFDRLGSTIVDLGNHFSTTEADIMAMAMRLGGAGTQIGMTQAEILAMSTALSSVGIEAEAGGSAFSKVMIQMQLATEKGGGAFDDLKESASNAGLSWETVSSAVRAGGKELKAVAGQMGFTSSELKKMVKEADKSATSLDNFADVAGMTSEQFGKLFKDDPSKAIMEFVNGLAHAEEKGTSAIKVLDDMDIKEVRLRDSLLRAANANGIFSEAIDLSNNAWKENNALTKEAETKYGTTASQIAIAKNKINDLAISFGNELLPVIADLLENSGPIIEWLKDIIKGFSDAGPETKKFALTLGAVAIAGGPVLTVLGGVTKGFGSVAIGAGKAIGWLGKAKIGMLGVEAAGTLAAGASGVGGVGALSAGLAAIAGPAAIAVGAVAAISLTAYAGKKAYEEHQLAGAKWGTEVTKEQDKVIEKSLELRNNAVKHVQEYADGVHESAEQVVKDNKAIVESIEQSMKKEQERKEKAIEKIDDEETKNQAKASLEWQKKVDEERLAQVQKRVDRINSIMENASKEQRNLSDEERTYIEANYKQLSDKQLEQAGFTKAERIAIESAYQKDVSKMSEKEIGERFTTLRKSLDKEKEDYDKQAKYIKEVWGEYPNEYKAQMDKLDTRQKQSTETMILGYAKLLKAQGYSLDEAKGFWEDYGWTVSEITKLVTNSADTSSQNLDMFAKGVNEADIQWNSLALDPKTGEVRSNMSDVLKELAETDEGWKQLKFMAKNADISTNAKEEIALAMVQAGKWDSLYISDKELLLSNDEAMLRLFESIGKLGQWDQYILERKELGIDNADVIWKMLDSEEKVNRWNGLPIDQKKMLAEDADFVSKMINSEELLNRWKELPDPDKKILGDNTDLAGKVLDSQDMLNRWNEFPVGMKMILADNTDAVSKIVESEEGYKRWIELPEKDKALLGNNIDLLNKVFASEQSYREWIQLPEPEKNIKANNNDLITKTSSAIGFLNDFNRIETPSKNLDSQTNAVEAKGFLDGLIGSWGSIPFYEKKEQVVEQKFIGPQLPGHEKGTNYHSGGDMIVNDQKGSLYREAVKFPGLDWVIPDGRNVYIKGAPRETKVMPAGMTRAKFKNYVNGTGQDSEMFMNPIPFRWPKQDQSNQSASNETAKIVTSSDKNEIRDVQVNVTIENVQMDSKNDVEQFSELLGIRVARDLKMQLER